MPTRSPVLVADDDPDDVFFLTRAFKKVGISNAIVLARNGQEVIDYLGGKGQFALMFLDLKMPMVDGFEVLAWLNQNPLERALPVVVLSSSNLETDIERAQEMGASDYCVKPQGFDELVEIVRRIRKKWLVPGRPA